MADEDIDLATSDDEDVELETTGEVIRLDVDTELVTLSVPQRKMGLRVVPYNVIARHPHYGALMFEPGAFGNVDPSKVRLRMDHEDPPTGIGTKYTDRADGAFMEFKVSKTQRGDEQLTLAADGVSRGTSPGFLEVVGKPSVRHMDGENVKVYGSGSAVLAELSTTWQPTFEGDGVAYMLHKEQKGSAPVAETEAPAAGASRIEPGIDYDRLAESFAGAIGSVLEAQKAKGDESKIDQLFAKFDELTELQRASFNVPHGETRKPLLRDWVQVTLKRMRGEAIPPTMLKELALDDVVTTEQPGLVPTVFSPDYDDIINNDRPFLNSTRQIAPPSTGTSMVLPIITTRGVAGSQAASTEKGALTTTATKVGTGTFAYAAVFGGADISLQMINRSDASFFDLLTGDMGMAYALDCDSKAVTALLTGYTDSASADHIPVDGSALGPLDPEDLTIGAAWTNSITVCKRAPDTIWMNSAAVQAFIDAKAPLTNAPLYSNLAAAFTAAGGPGGTISGLRPIYVPALDSAAVDVIIGPSRGFVWAEDPARQIQADVPSVAGRDIALVGGIFPAPRYADAFTTYTVTS